MKLKYTAMHCKACGKELDPYIDENEDMCSDCLDEIVDIDEENTIVS